MIKNPEVRMAKCQTKNGNHGHSNIWADCNTATVLAARAQTLYMIATHTPSQLISTAIFKAKSVKFQTS
jgi:hypothetical protein